MPLHSGHRRNGGTPAGDYRTLPDSPGLRHYGAGHGLHGGHLPARNGPSERYPVHRQSRTYRTILRYHDERRVDEKGHRPLGSQRGGRRRPVRGGHRPQRPNRGDGHQPRNGRERPHGPCRSAGDTGSGPAAGYVRPERMRNIHLLRAMSHVPGRHLLGAAGQGIFCQRERGREGHRFR